MLFLALVACPLTGPSTKDSSTATGDCGTQYGTSDPACTITCEGGSYCTQCLAAPDTSDTADDIVWACIPCGAAC